LTVLDGGSDVVAQGKTGDEIANNEVLVSFEWLILLSAFQALLHSLMDVLHRSSRPLVVLPEDGLKQALIFRLVTAHIVNRQFLKNHFVLR